MKIRATTSLLLFATWLAAIDFALAADPIILRTAVTPREAWVGQKVVLHVDILAKDGWAQLTKVADTSVDGAYLIRLETQGTRLGETIEGDSYSGQRYEFMVFAQREGKLTIPSVPVDVEVKTWGAAGGAHTERLQTPAVEIVASMPPGAEGIRGLISTSSLTANQRWDPKTEGMVVGDAIRRSITMSAEDVSGMAFVPRRYGQIEDAGIYPGEPVVDDKFARGSLTGTRIETVTYVFERAGDFEIPDILMSWWDVDANELKQLVLPGLSLQVAANPAALSDTRQESSDQRRMRVMQLSLLAITVIGAAVFFFGKQFAIHWAAWRKARRERESMYFRRVRRSARSGDPKAVLRDTMRWLDRINEHTQPARLDEFLARYGAIQPRVDTLNLDKAGIALFMNQLSIARKQWQSAAKREYIVSRLLPDLNGK